MHIEFMQIQDRSRHKAFPGTLPQSRPFKYRFWQDKLGFTLLRVSYAVLQSFLQKERPKLKPCCFPSYGPNQYSLSLQNHMHKIRGRMRLVSYCYLVSPFINSFSNWVLFARFIWLAILLAEWISVSITTWAPFPWVLSLSFRAKECAQWSSSNQQNRLVLEELLEV